jgi:hypothetical protein
MKQNRDLRPSKRQRFKENNRETIYAGSNKKNKPSFKEFSEFQVKKTIARIREDAISKKRSDLIFTIVLFGIVGFFIASTIFSKENTVKLNTDSNTVIDSDTSTPIVWSGKMSDPLELLFSDLYYAPKIGNWDSIAQIEKNYEINSTTMVVDSLTTNILFFDDNCKLINRLLPEDGHIRWMYVGPIKENLGPKRNLYALAKEDTNNDGLINDEDTAYLFISEPDGKDLMKITDRGVTSLEWIGKGNELLIEFYNANDFFNRQKQVDSLYGIFNTETKTLRLTNQKLN